MICYAHVPLPITLHPARDETPSALPAVLRCARNAAPAVLYAVVVSAHTAEPHQRTPPKPQAAPSRARDEGSTRPLVAPIRALVLSTAGRTLVVVNSYSVPKLPPKKIFGKFNPDFVHKRQQQLNAWLQKLLELYGARASLSYHIRSFLTNGAARKNVQCEVLKGRNGSPRQALGSRPPSR